MVKFVLSNIPISSLDLTNTRNAALFRSFQIHKLSLLKWFAFTKDTDSWRFYRSKEARKKRTQAALTLACLFKAGFADRSECRQNLFEMEFAAIGSIVYFCWGWVSIFCWILNLNSIIVWQRTGLDVKIVKAGKTKRKKELKSRNKS